MGQLFGLIRQCGSLWRGSCCRASSKPSSSTPSKTPSSPKEYACQQADDIDLSVLLVRLDHRLDSEKVRIATTYENDLNSYSILARIDLPTKQALVERCKHVDVLDRIMGTICGMAIGDALGHPFEFISVTDLPCSSHFDLQTMKFHNEFNKFALERGQWTDDCSMGLCMADSLIMRRQFDGSDIRARFWCWWYRGYNNTFRKDTRRETKDSVGLGANVQSSLEELHLLQEGQGGIPPTYEAPGTDAGNGSLIRLSPVAIFLHTATVVDLHRLARLSSYTTHPGIYAAEACAFLAHLIRAAIHRPPGNMGVRRFLDVAAEEYYVASALAGRSGPGYNEMKWLVTSSPERDTERCWNWKSESLDIASSLRARGMSYNGYMVSADYFGSYSLDGLAAALWAVYNTRSFDEAVARSVNLCGDADSHGSITGQLAGAFYGYSTINPQFIEWLTRWDDHEIAVRGLLLQHFGAEAASSGSLGGGAGPPDLFGVQRG